MRIFLVSRYYVFRDLKTENLSKTAEQQVKKKKKKMGKPTPILQCTEPLLEFEKHQQTEKAY